MPTMDATAKAALDGSVIAPAFFIYLDVDGDPVRITTFGTNITFAGTGDTDLDTFTFSAIDARAIHVGEVSNSDSGSDTVNIELSGIVSIDTALLNEIGDTSKWRGRTARLWFRIYDADSVPQGAIVPYYTGYMSSVNIMPSPHTQTIRLSVENYLAIFNQASNRTYMNQKDYDAADTSAAATLAAANGAHHHKGAAGSGGGGGGVVFSGNTPGITITPGGGGGKMYPGEIPLAE